MVKANIYFEQLDKTSTGTPYAPIFTYYWLDGKVINSGITLDLSYGKHTFGVGFGRPCYPKCDGTAEVEIPQTKCYCTIYVKHKWVGFFKPRLQIMIEIR